MRVYFFFVVEGEFEKDEKKQKKPNAAEENQRRATFSGALCQKKNESHQSSVRKKETARVERKRKLGKNPVNYTQAQCTTNGSPCC